MMRLVAFYDAYKWALSLIFPVVIAKMEGQQKNLAIYAFEVFIIVVEIILLIYLGSIKVF